MIHAGGSCRPLDVAARDRTGFNVKLDCEGDVETSEEAPSRLEQLPCRCNRGEIQRHGEFNT
jgi:hypothetical protein